MTRRLLASYLAVTAFVLAVLAVPLGRTVADNERRSLMAAVEQDAFVLAGLVEDALEQDAPVALDRVADTYAGRTGARVVITDADGIGRGDSDPLSAAPRDFSTRAEIRSALDGRVDAGNRFSETLDTGLLYVAVPVASGGEVHGAVRITYPTAAVDARIRRSWVTLATVGAVVLLAAGVVGVAIARWVARPVRQLDATAQRLAAGDLDARARTEAGPPEIRALAATLNTMAARLSSLLDAQRAFVADASHQLRSPLTALRLRLEGIDGLGPDQERQVEAAVDESARLARLIDGLLTLARAEASRTERDAVDPAEVVTARAQAWEPLAAELDVTLALDVQPGPPVLELPGALGQIVDNYLANALQVAPPGSTVMLRTRSGSDGTTVSVIDRGRGLSEEQRDRAFDRFWRGDPQPEGFGLGLPIVERLAVASGGRAKLRAGPGGVGIEALVVLRHAPPRARPTRQAGWPVRIPGTTS